MGNWMTVTIEGSIDPADAGAARAFVDITDGTRRFVNHMDVDWDRFHCLCFCGPSLQGLGLWIPEAGGEFRAVGNLAERDYGPESVAETLRGLVAVAPSLRLKVHCGGDYESTDCVATVTVADGTVSLGSPEVAEVGDGLAEMGIARLGVILGASPE